MSLINLPLVKLIVCAIIFIIKKRKRIVWKNIRELGIHIKNRKMINNQRFHKNQSYKFTNLEIKMLF